MLTVCGLGGYLVGTYRWRTNEAAFRSHETPDPAAESGRDGWM